MTTPPTVPQPPSMPSMGLDDLDDDMAGTTAVHENDGQQPVASNWSEDPDVVLNDAPPTAIDYDALEKASPDTDADEIEPGVPAQPEAAVKERKMPVAIDWTKAVPRKADDFVATGPPALLSPVLEKIREFLNAARQNGWYDLYYPVMQFSNRNTAQSNVTKVNQWRKGKTNQYGVRDGENINAKCETKSKGEYILWVALLKDPGAKGEVNPPQPTPSIHPDPTPAAE